GLSVAFFLALIQRQAEFLLHQLIRRSRLLREPDDTVGATAAFLEERSASLGGIPSFVVRVTALPQDRHQAVLVFRFLNLANKPVQGPLLLLAKRGSRSAAARQRA